MKRFSFKRFLLVGVFGLWLWGAVGVAGPWRAQVVDAETGKPLKGVVILTWWTKFYRSVGGWAGGEYYASEEVVTGPDGRFTISRRWTFTPSPGWSIIKGPEWIIFKPGYGRWSFQGYQDEVVKGELQYEALEAWYDKKWAQFEGAGVVITLKPLKTKEERLGFYHQLIIPSEVPDNRKQRFREAEDTERQFLGFGR